MDIKILLFLFVLVALLEVNQVGADKKKVKRYKLANGTIITTKKYVKKENRTTDDPMKTKSTYIPWSPQSVTTTRVQVHVTDKPTKSKTTTQAPVIVTDDPNKGKTSTLAPHQKTDDEKKDDEKNDDGNKDQGTTEKSHDVFYVEDPKRDEEDEEKELAKEVFEVKWGEIDKENHGKIPEPPVTICKRGSTRIKLGNPVKRRYHMNSPAAGDETCEICVCNTNGLEEKCSKRPARNVNECIRLAKIKEYLAKHPYFNHEQTLAGRIRRDYLWHRDEIPYLSNAVCYRGASYYTNAVEPKNQTIDVSSDVESILDYPRKSVCHFCVCNLGGTETTCIKRDRWFCDYLRYLRGENYDPRIRQREMYMERFNEDRPAYFRSLSYRLRRTMDDGINGLLELSGGDTLCCDHPNGHRRSLQRKVRDKLLQLRKKVTKENLLGHAAGDYEDFVVNND